jgi:hypothetical protein
MGERQTHLDVEIISIDIRIKFFKQCIWRNQSSFKHQNTLDQAGKTACCLKMSEVCFNGTSKKFVLVPTNKQLQEFMIFLHIKRVIRRARGSEHPSDRVHLNGISHCRSSAWVLVRSPRGSISQGWH